MTAATRIIVDADGGGTRLDRFLTSRGAWGSRAQVQRMITQGRVRLDGRTARASAVLRTGQTIDVEGGGPVAAPAAADPEAIPLDIIFEDAWVLVINKPAGLVVHPAPGHWQGTLVSALLHHWHGSRPGLDPSRPGIVHRLDKDTSGVLLIAKDAATLTGLGTQFRDRTVAKQYVAAVWGSLRRPSGEIATPIGRNPVHRKQMAVRPGGREALTRFEVIERGRRMTFVRLYPRTGRTHQLRVHLSAIGHPIVGDRVYGRARDPETLAVIKRQALHAERLTFRHPQTGATLTFTAPWPADLLGLRQHDTEQP